MVQCMDSDNLHRRLKKIVGQINAIDRMIDEDVPCEDVLAQINAAKSALHKAGQLILEGHIKHCVLEGIQKGEVDETISRFTKTQGFKSEGVPYTNELLRTHNKEGIPSDKLFGYVNRSLLYGVCIHTLSGYAVCDNLGIRTA